MKTKIKLVIGALLFSFAGISQTTEGTIYGRVLDMDSSTTLGFAKLWVETPGGNIYKNSDVDGKYKFTGLKPGIAILHCKYTGKEEIIYRINVSPDGLHLNDIVFRDNVLGIVIVDAGAPKIETDIISVRIPTTDIKRSPYVRDPLALLSGTSSDIKMMEGTSDVIIRGSRPGDAIYYLDGVKMTSMTSLPGAGIGSLQAYTGGIPAKYGDTTGGVIIVESKSYFDLYYAWKAMQGN